MAETNEVWTIPGDEVSVELGRFEHHQHLLNVYAVYVHEADTTMRLELIGEPVEAAPPRTESSNKVVYTSIATMSEIIDEKMRPGRYWFQGFECYTYGDQRLRFQQQPEQPGSAGSMPPTHIVVQPEPTTGPQSV